MSVIFVALVVTLVHARACVDAAMRSLRHDAEHDAVTGPLSRRTFDHDIEHIDDRAVALVVIDIDDFKSVNDSFGHAVGDDVLRIVASCIASNRRQAVEASPALWLSPATGPHWYAAPHDRQPWRRLPA